MKRFEDLSLREKLIRAMVTITAAVLVPVAAFIVLVDFFLLRQSTIRSLAILGDAVAYNSSAALAFDDPEDAMRVLQAFQAESNVTEALLFDLGGEVLAAYSPEEPFEAELPDVRADWPVIEGGTLHHLTPVWEGDTQLGWLVIRYDLGALQKRLILYLLSIVAMAAFTLLIAYFLSIAFQAKISGPILALENVARKISESHDYSTRAPRKSDDEIGSLTQAFNNMLEQIAAKEAALLLSEERLRAAVEASRTGVWDWDLKTGKVVWIGSIFDSLVSGSDASGARGQPFYAAIHQEDRRYVQRRVEEAVKRGLPFEADFRVSARGGEIRNVRARGQTFMDEQGAPVRMVGAIVDITDLRAAQAAILDLNKNLEAHVQERTTELRRALGEIESFNYSVSHDLRSPLRAINGFSRALLEDYHDKLDETGQNFLGRIVASCQRMGQLIDDLLKLSRITKQEMRKEPVDLSALAREIVTTLRGGHEAREVEVRIEDGLRAEGDPRLLAIALGNLLQNAWKFTSRKKDALIEVGRLLEDGQPVFFVRDNGAGFDMAFAENLFGVFQRLHTSADFEGTGIGLATVRRIIERHGGAVRATGALDAGATFYFTLPPSDR